MIKIEKDTSVGIYDNCQNIARIYPDRTIVHQPGIKWDGNSGTLHTYKHRITGDAHADILKAVTEDEDGMGDQTAWGIINDATSYY